MTNIIFGRTVVHDDAHHTTTADKAVATKLNKEREAFALDFGNAGADDDEIAKGAIKKARRFLLRGGWLSSGWAARRDGREVPANDIHAEQVCAMAAVLKFLGYEDVDEAREKAPGVWAAVTSRIARGIVAVAGAPACQRRMEISQYDVEVMKERAGGGHWEREQLIMEWNDNHAQNVRDITRAYDIGVAEDR